jgi:hypothetical protein
VILQITDSLRYELIPTMIDAGVAAKSAPSSMISVDGSLIQIAANETTAPTNLATIQWAFSLQLARQ